jgi:regulator of sigma E protease
MIDLLYTIISFLIAIGILIAIHEFGHFWVAKKLGVKVLRYSIGMGKPIWKKTFGPDKTEFVLAAIPIGGYVSMLNEHEGEVADDEKHRAFNRQPIWKRSLIVLAGPLFNFFLAILIYWGISVWGVEGVKPIIKQVEINSIASQAGLKKGDQIVDVEGWDTPTWDAVFQEAIPKLISRSRLSITVKDKSGAISHHQLDLSTVNINRSIKRPMDEMGMYSFELPAVIDKVIEGKSAESAGLRAGDRIVKLGDKKINHWYQVAHYLEDKANQTFPIVVEREGELLTYSITPYEENIKGIKIGRIGAAVQIPEQRATDFEKAVNQYSPIAAIGYALHRTWIVTYTTGKALSLMVTMQMSLSNISGPINIAVVAGKTASIGVIQYILFLAIVSISLGILNLLPIPILDGGHLVYYVIEAIKGSPVSEYTEAVGQRIGIMFLVMLMLLAFYNDIMRLAS